MSIARTSRKPATATAGNAFVFNLEHRLASTDIEAVTARATLSDGTRRILRVLKDKPTPSAEPAPLEKLEFTGKTSDPRQRPVFILGAARSGTSAVLQALLKVGRFEGQNEGHLLDLRAHLQVALTKFYELKHDDFERPDTMISFVPRDYMEAMLDDVFLRTIAELFPAGRWLDKTPNANMIHMVPHFRKIWPSSRFIFHAAAVPENAASRSVKFPTYSFGHNCQEWNDAMSAWLEVREQAKGAAIELDQTFVRDQPEAAAAAIARLAGLNDLERDRLGQALKLDRPERTSETAPNLDMTTLAWEPHQLDQFQEICSGTMEAYGYSLDARYYREGEEAAGLVWL